MQESLAWGDLEHGEGTEEPLYELGARGRWGACVELHPSSMAVVRRSPREAQGLSLGACTPPVTATVGASARFSQGRALDGNTWPSLCALCLARRAAVAVTVGTVVTTATCAQRRRGAASGMRHGRPLLPAAIVPCCHTHVPAPPVSTARAGRRLPHCHVRLRSCRWP